MPLITQGKTNWKFLLIVVVLAAVVGGGTLWYARTSKQPHPLPETKKQEIPKEIPKEIEEASIKVIFPNGGEILQIGETYTIRWESSGIEFVNIYLREENIKENCYLNEEPIIASLGSYTVKLDKFMCRGMTGKLSPHPIEPRDSDWYIINISVPYESDIQAEDWSDDYFGIMKNKAADAPEDSVQGLRTYRNEEYGFEIKYPREWQYIREKEEFGFAAYFYKDYKELSEARVIFVIGVNLIGDFPVAFAQCASGEEIEIAGIKTKKFNYWKYSTQGERIEVTSPQCQEDPSLTNIDSSIKKEDDVYEFGFFCREEGWEGAEGREKCNNLYDQILSTFRFIDKNISCEENSKYFVISRESEGISDFLVKFKTNSDQIIPCSYVVDEKDFEIKNQQATYFLALTNNFLILDRGTAPPPRILLAYNLNTREKVYTDKYSYPFKVLNDTITYWSPINEEVTEDNCPEFYELYELYGVGAEIEAYVILDLTDLVKKELGEYRCSYRQ